MRAIIFIVIVTLFALPLGGCGLLQREKEMPPVSEGDRPPVTNRQLRETVFYFPDSNWKTIVPVRLRIPWEEGIAKATLRYTIAGHTPHEVQEAGLSPLLPAGTEILGLSIKDGLARVDLTEAFLNYPPERERLLIYGLIYTLTEFPTISKVQVLVGGKKPELPGGMPVGEPLTRELGVNLEIAAGLENLSDTERVTLYFLYPPGSKALYTPVMRVIPPAGDLVTAAVTELLRGPVPGGTLFSAIPRGVALQAVTVKNGKATVRLTGDLAGNGGGQLAADQIRHQIGLTLTEIPGITEVQVLVDGKKPEFPYGVNFPELFGRPDQWNLLNGG